MTRVLVPLAPGFEEIEAVSIIDVLRRAGLEVVTAAVPEAGETAAPERVTGSHGIALHADARLDVLQPQDFDALVLPGGEPGTTNLAASPHVQECLRAFARADKPRAAICAAPRVLAAAGQLRDLEATSHPSVEPILRRAGASYRQDRVVRAGRILTSRGPGTALEFSLELLRVLGHADAAERLRRDMLAASA